MKINVDGLISSKADPDVRFSLAKIHRVLADAINKLFSAFTVDGANVTAAGNVVVSGGGVTVSGGGVTVSGGDITATGTRRILVTGSGLLGYGTGSGGTVNQATSKTTGVTLNKTNGEIVMDAASMAAGAVVSFRLTNSNITFNDGVTVNVKDYVVTPANYRAWISPANGSAVICVENRSAGALAEAVVLTFVVIKGSTS